MEHVSVHVLLLIYAVRVNVRGLAYLQELAW